MIELLTLAVLLVVGGAYLISLYPSPNTANRRGRNWPRSVQW